jgi:hypothetical protein
VKRHTFAAPFGSVFWRSWEMWAIVRPAFHLPATSLASTAIASYSSLV